MSSAQHRFTRRRAVRTLAALPAAGVLMTDVARAARQATPAATPAASPVASPVAGPAVLPVAQIAQLTGYAPPSINDTADDYAVVGCDLGHTFVHGDDIYMVFGDTFDAFQSDWRSNCAAIITKDQDPSDGLTFDRMITDKPGHAKELLSSKKVDNVEMTVIPTYGIAVGDRLYLHYMSVKHWGEPGHWELGAAGFAWSDDKGETWTKDPKAILPGETNFGQVSMEAVEGYVHIHGIPGGRFGGVKLARVPEAQLLSLDSWEFWTGKDWSGTSEKAAAEIVPAPVGELSVRHHSHYDKWVMMYLNEDRHAIVLRTADELPGPWSEEAIVATAADYPALYAPYQLPKWNDGREIFFTMSLFGPYEVFLMRTRLE